MAGPGPTLAGRVTQGVTRVLGWAARPSARYQPERGAEWVRETSATAPQEPDEVHQPERGAERVRETSTTAPQEPDEGHQPERGAGLTRGSIAWAYRLFLDREPESEAVIDEKLAYCASTAAVRATFLEADEYRRKNPPQPTPALQGDEPAMEVDEELSESDLRRLFDHVQATWQHLGEEDPFWSVSTLEQYRSDQFEQNREQFYAAGQWDVRQMMRTLERNGLDRREFREILEYGCGVGRIMRWLSEEFERVHGVDISRPHLRSAEAYLQQQGISNVTFGLMDRLEDVETLPQVDLIYSVIVLQHNPPPVIRHVLHRLLRVLRPGGVAYFQVPTYRQGYRFRFDEYMSGEATRLDMEMHVLPQRTVFEVARAEGCAILEVREDGCTGSRFKEVSNTFLVRKGA